MFRSPGIRFFVVGVLAFLMFIPLIMVTETIQSRRGYSESTITSVGREWGGVQLIRGPQLVIPVEGWVTRNVRQDIVNSDGETESVMREIREIAIKEPVFVLPDQLTIDVNTTSQERRRGIFVAPVYSALAEIDFTFDPSKAEPALSDGDRLLWDRAYVEVGLQSNAALRGGTQLQIDDTLVALDPMTSDQGIFGAVGDPREHAAYKLNLVFNGAQNLRVTPVGLRNQVNIQSDWPHPSFFGEFLPIETDISDAGFAAHWDIPHLARNLPNVARHSQLQNTAHFAFGVKFYQPNDFYQKAYRVANYGILFIGLTFLTILLIEDRKNRPTHPVQYLLMGLVQALFALLMVAYAEHLGFNLAYMIASAATIGLLVLYAFVGLKAGKRSLVIGALLVVLYSVLYLILRSEDYALIAGSSLVFVALAVTMLATRNEEWFGSPKEGFWKPSGSKKQGKQQLADQADGATE